MCTVPDVASCGHGTQSIGRKDPGDEGLQAISIVAHGVQDRAHVVLRLSTFALEPRAMPARKGIFMLCSFFPGLALHSVKHRGGLPQESRA